MNHTDDTSAGTTNRSLLAARRPLLPVLLLGAVGVALVAGGLLLRRSHTEPSPEPELLVGDAGLAAAPAAPPDGALPPVEESDAQLSSLLGSVSSHALLHQWLGVDDLLTRVVAVVDNVADGSSPHAHLAFLAPGATMEAHVKGRRLYADPASFARYDRIADVVATVHAAELAEVVRQLLPLLDRAYGAFGYPGRPFRPVLERALARLLQTPVTEGPVELVPKGAMYAYADERLEALSDAQKHLLRMGPRNARIVLDKVREFQNALRRPVAARAQGATP